MMGHKICFNGAIWLVIPKLSLLPLLIWSTGVSNYGYVPQSHLENIVMRIETTTEREDSIKLSHVSHFPSNFLLFLKNEFSQLYLE